jgi:DNA mismatch repair ATPase MutS
MATKIDGINNHFKLPIHYNDKKKQLKSNIIQDLELIETIDASSNNIYSYYFNNVNDMSEQIMSQVSECYTTDVEFLKDNQTLLQTYRGLDDKKHTDISNKYEKIRTLWNEIKNDTGFKDKYYYLNWPMLEFLNKSDRFLQMMTLYNMASPIISLFIPLIILIVPFFVIKMKGVAVTMSEYMDVLKVVISNNAIGKLFTQFSSVSNNERIYMLVSAAFYVFSIYQNVVVCMRYNSNMIKIHQYLKDIREYIDSTTDAMNNYLTYSSKLKTHEKFNTVLSSKIKTLLEFKDKISFVSEYKLLNHKKMFEIGHILKCFYEFYEDKTCNDSFMYSFGFNGYLDCIEGLKDNIREKKVNFAKFTLKRNKVELSNNYYACLKDHSPVKNTIRMKQNMIITGPNASGKTTVLKSTLINILFTQQFGCGFYDSAKIKPYDHIHCYLNIPDTSGRDSLFQAEARRCKEILDVVDTNKKDSHFCTFDELYSGTNPDEAVMSATAFMEYLIKKKNVSCMLTTHFVEVCNQLDTNRNIINCHMVTTRHNNKLEYKYELTNGISNVKGGVNVLSDMNYPAEIINRATQTNQIVNSLSI